MIRVDVDGLRARVAARVGAWHRGAVVGSIAPLEGGASSLTYAVDVDGAPESHGTIVLKLAPPGLRPTRNRDVLRQARVLRALSGVAGVRVPAVLFEDAGDPPEVPPLFAMAYVEGESFEPIMDERDELPPAGEIRARAVDAARMLASLHALEPDAIGLGHEPRAGLHEEVERWARVFETVDDGLRPRYREAAAALAAALPEALPPAVGHGEFRLGNTLCADGRVTAIIDWEIWAIQDPRLDLAWFLQFCDRASQPSAVREAPPGMPSAAELLECYEAARGASVPGLRWFHAHARYKQAAIAALVTKHNRRRPDPDPRQEERAAIIPELVDAAIALAS